MKPQYIVGASPVLAVAANAAAASVVTLAPTLGGVLHLNRLLGAATGEATLAGQVDWDLMPEAFEVQELEIFNTDQYVRGRSATALGRRVPGWDVSPLRQRQYRLLGDQRVSSQDTLAMSSFHTRVGQTMATWFACPLTPDKPPEGRNNIVDPNAESYDLGSNDEYIVPASNAGTITVEIEADKQGVVDLSSLQLAVGASAALAAGAPPNLIAACAVESYKLPNGNDLIIGNSTGNTPRLVPATTFGNGRQFTWANLGQYEVSAGDKFLITMRNFADIAGKVRGSVRFWDKRTADSCPC